jgi:hypothetical protein
MAKVLCNLPNASELINGVKFITHKLGMISEEIEDDVAAEFSKITGYQIAGAPAPQDDAAVAAMADLKAKAEALGIKVDTRWKAERLTTEIQNAEASAAAASGKTE